MHIKSAINPSMLIISLLLSGLIIPCLASHNSYAYSLNLRGDIPLNEIAYDGIYQAIEHLQNYGFFGGVDYYDRPFDFKDVRNDLLKINPDSLPYSALWEYNYIKRRLGLDARPKGFHLRFDSGITFSGFGKIPTRFRFHPDIDYTIGNFYLESRYTIGSKSIAGEKYGGKVWGGVIGYGDLVYSSYRQNKIAVYLGRRKLEWGPNLTGSLILSGKSMPYDGFSFNYNFRGNLKLSAFTFILDPYQNVDGSYQERYLSGHRLTWEPKYKLTIGISEVVIYGGEGRNPEVYYFFPLFFLHGSQLNQGIDDNTLIEADFRWLPFSATEIYGQILIDDFQIEKKTLEDNEPTEYGLLFGINRSELPFMPYLQAGAEYVRIANRTYDQPLPRNKYINRGYYIGYPLGNDGDLFTAQLILRLKDKIKFTGEFSRQRKGEGRIENDWDTPWMDEPNYTEKFPTGTVQTTNKFELIIEYAKNEHFISKVTAYRERITNKNHILNDNYSDNISMEFSIDFLF